MTIFLSSFDPQRCWPHVRRMGSQSHREETATSPNNAGVHGDTRFWPMGQRERLVVQSGSSSSGAGSDTLEKRDFILRTKENCYEKIIARVSMA